MRLVLFCKYPTPGEAKTRLIPEVGAHGAAAIHKRLAERTLAVLREADAGTVEVAFTGSNETEFRAWLGDDIDFSPQVAGELTARLLDRVEPVPVIFFGADTPELSRDLVAGAAKALQGNDVVIGPAEDGGYYLIGMARSLPELFTDMPWSTDEVLPETLDRLQRLEITPHMLPTLADCDRPEDLARWPWLTE